MLSLATGVEATPDSVFQIGSTTKLWTASLVMQLVDEGCLDLDQPVRRYLPEFRIADESAAASITARQLLSHTAGFEGDIFTDTGKGDDCLEKYVLTLGDTPQLFPPGERFSYNNAGYCVLGRLVEVLREKPFDDCLRERLFTPLGLTHAANGPYEAILFRAAVGHVRADARTPSSGAGTGLGAGPLERPGRIDARDAPPRPARLRADAHERRAERPTGPWCCHPDAVELDVHARTSSCPGSGSWATPGASGPELFQTPDGLLAGHDGNTIGQAAFLRFVPDKGVAVALLTNGGDTFALYRDVVGHVLGGARRRDPAAAARRRPPHPSASTPAATWAPTPRRWWT